MARTHVILDDELLADIDKLVGERGRSRFLEEAAREKLDRERLRDAIQATAGLLKDKPGYEHWRDAETTYRWVREGRSGLQWIGPPPRRARKRS